MPPLLLALARRGFTVTAVSGRLAVNPASRLTPADRAALRADRAELISHLTCPTGGWCDRTVAALMVAADELVERLGLPSAHPELRRLAERVGEVLPHRNLAEFLARLRVFESAARRLAAGRPR